MNVEADIEIVLSVIKITREKYEEHIVGCTKIVTDQKTSDHKIDHLIHGSLCCKETPAARYVIFGADKCGVSDVRKFFDILDIDFQDLEDAIAEYPLGRDTPDFHFRGYLLCSRSKDLCINVSSKYSNAGSFHFMNVTAEEPAGLRAFKAFKDLGDYSGICWGGYW